MVIVTNKRKEILRKVVQKYDEEKAKREAGKIVCDSNFEKYKECIKKVSTRVRNKN